MTTILAPAPASGALLEPDWWWSGLRPEGRPASGIWLIPAPSGDGQPPPSVTWMPNGWRFTGQLDDTLRMPWPDGTQGWHAVVSVGTRQGGVEVGVNASADRPPLMVVQNPGATGLVQSRTVDVIVDVDSEGLVLRLTGPSTVELAVSLSAPTANGLVSADAPDRADPMGDDVRARLLSVVLRNQRPRTRLPARDGATPSLDALVRLLEEAGDTVIAGSARFVRDVAALSSDDVAVCGELHRRWQSGLLARARDLVHYERPDWEDVLRRSYPDAPVADRGPEAQRLLSAVETRYPGPRLAARIVADPTSPLHDPEVVAYLAANPEVDLLTEPFHRMPPTVDPGLRSTLDRIQRIARVAPRHDQVVALSEAGHHSAASIARQGRSSFVAAQADQLGGAEAADQVFERAALIAARAFAVYAANSPSFNRVDPRALASAREDDPLPEWRSLFGDRLDLVADDPARSVLSPAAYLTDLLHFLEGMATTGGNALTVLLERRPDLRRVQLSQPNVETAVPAIDLVNELLEIEALGRGSLDPDWVGSAPPLGATPRGAWAVGHDSAPVPWSGANDFHKSPDRPGYQHHGFTVAAAQGRTLAAGARLAVWVRVDVNQPADRLVLRWTFPDGDRVVTWGSDPVSNDPVDRGVGRIRGGGRPAVGRWTLLTVGAAELGVDGQLLTGIDYGCVDGAADWGPSGPIAASVPEATEGTELERRGRPQQLIWPAYAGLTQTVFPWATQPFDLGRRSVAAVCEALGVDQVALATTFPANPLDPVDLALTRLGITPGLRSILVGQDGQAEALHWGLDPATDWLAKLSSAVEFLPRAGLAAADLYAAPGAGVCPGLALIERPVADGGTELEVRGLTAASTPTLRRFLRLWRCLGGDCAELERFVLTFTAAPAHAVDDALLVRLGVAVTAARILGVSLAKVTAWWSDLLDARQLADPMTYPADGPLGAARSPWVTTLQRPGLGELAATFALTVDGSLRTATTVKDARPALCAALRVSDAGLAALLADPLGGTGLDPATAEAAPLTPYVVSALHRDLTLADALKISVADFLTLRALSADDPFDADHPEQLLGFISRARAVANQPVPLADLEHALRHVRRSGSEPILDSPALAVETIIQQRTVGTLAESSAADPTGDGLRRLLAGATDVDVDPVLSVLARAHRFGVALALDPQLPAAITTLSWSAEFAELSSGVLTTAERDAAIAVVANPTARQAIEQLYQRPRAILAALPGFNAALADQIIDAPAGDPAYAAVSAVVRPVLQRRAAVGSVMDVLATRLKLDPVAVRIILQGLHGSGGVSALDELSELDSSADPARKASAGRLVSRADRLAALCTAQSLSPAMIGFWFAGGPGAGWLNPNDLPDTPTASGDLDGWLALVECAELTKGGGVTESLVLGVLERAQDPDPAHQQSNWAQTVRDLAQLLDCGADQVEQLVTALGVDRVDGFQTATALVRLRRAHRLCQVFGADPERVAGWAHGNSSAVIGADMIAYAHAQHGDGLLQPVEDALRVARRDALRDFISPGLHAGQVMFARLLSDPDVSVTATTTRVAAATHAVQLYMQRALLDLEPITVSHAQRQEWSWLSSYDSWYAARARFLHPENYLDPDARTDATAGYVALQHELAHGDLTEDNARTAFTNYLKGLDAVAQLEPVALYVQNNRENNKLVDSVLHVVARTSATPHKYFHRIRDGKQQWGDWEAVEVEISTDLVAAYVLDRVPYLFWLELLEQGDESGAQPNTMQQPKRKHQYRLAWTVRDATGWSAKRVSADTRPLDPPTRIDDLFLDMTWTTDASVLRLPVRVYGGPLGVGQRAYIERGSFIFDAAAQSVSFVEAKPGSTDSSVLTPGSGVPSYQSWVFAGGVLELPAGLGTADAVLTASPKVRMTFAGAPEWIVFNKRQSVDTHLPFFLEAFGLPLFAVDQESGGDARLYRFHLGYHPYTKAFLRQLARGGTAALLARDTQLHPETLESDRRPLSFASLGVTGTVDPASDMQEIVDFAFGGPYAAYNWETFFHAPRLIAQRLLRTQRFEEARAWLETVFDPTDRSKDVAAPQKYWQTKPLYLASSDLAVEKLLAALDGQPDNVGERQIALWRDDPFNPDLIARVRVSAYQKATVMAYLDLLVACADALLAAPTAEKVEQALALYVLASELLGPRPLAGAKPGALVGDGGSACYEELRGGLNSFSDAVVTLENRLSAWQTAPSGENHAPITPAAALSAALYFHVPVNQKLLSYWDLVEQRLANLRAGIGPQGQSLHVPPYPQIRGQRSAEGADAGQALAVARPVYRFATLHARAAELAGEVRGLAAALLAALEKRDAEGLAVLHAGHEHSVLSLTRQVRETQLIEASQQVVALQASQAVLRDKERYYGSREQLNDLERLQVSHLQSAAALQVVSQGLDALGSALGLIPEFNLGVSGFAASPVVTGAFGGRELSTVAAIAARLVSMQAGLESHLANMASLSAGWQRRWEDWRFQYGQATLEVQQLDRQIDAATSRVLQARQELEGHDLQVANAGEVSSYLQRKFTNAALYDWLAGQLAGVYGQAYRLALQAAQRAERAFQFELADGSTFIKASYWDSLRAGLGAADHLILDLHRMNAAYLERNVRADEMTKSVSLALVDPEALLRLRTTGRCELTLSESMFDLDNPGHYLRRIREVALTVPCISGPYGGVNCTLTLLADSVRTSPALRQGRYVRQGLGDDRFVDHYGSGAQLRTSGGLNQTGTFDGGHDDRYGTYEGAGAISSWQLSLPADTNSFPLDTVTDVVLTVKYTARYGGAVLEQGARREVIQPLRRRGARLLSLRHDLPDSWQRYIGTTTPGARTLAVPLVQRLLPLAAGEHSVIDQVTLLALTTADLDTTVVEVATPTGATSQVTLEADAALGGALSGPVALATPEPMGNWSITVTDPAALPLVDVFLLLTYGPAEA